MISMRTAIGFLSVLVIFVMVSAMPGCGNEERGPILSGGREMTSWVADMHNPSPRVRRQAVLKLGNTGDSSPAVVEVLVAALQDSDALVRRDAIRAVVKLKQPDPIVKERLEAISRGDKDSLARDLAGKALIHMGGG